jgi:hypothetical protein
MNTHASFSFSAMISSGWETFKRHWKFIILAGIATAIVEIALRIIQNGVGQGRGNWLIDLIAMLFIILVSIIITVGWSKVMLSLVRSGHTTWSTFKSEPVVWVRYVKAYLWYAAYMIGWTVLTVLPGAILTVIGLAADVQALIVIGVILGSIALVLTAIYFGIRYQFLRYVIIDYPELSGRNLFKKAGAITKGSLLQLLGFGVVVGLVNLLGLICIVVGLVVTVPATKLATVKVYNYLKEHHAA